MPARTRKYVYGVFRGDVLRQARKEKKLSQQKLSAATGISRTSISYLEAGMTTDPAVARVAVLAKALDLPMEHLIDHDKAAAAV